MEHSLEASQQQCDRDDRSAQNKNNAGRVVRPDKQRQAHPGHPGRTHGVNRNDEVQAGQNRRETIDEDPDHRGRYGGVRINAAQRRIKGPACVQAAGGERIQNERSANQVNVPAQEIDFRKGQVLRADHDRYHEIAQHRRNRRNQEKENHGHAMHRKQLVVGFWRNQITGGRQQVDADQRSEQPTDKKEEGHRNQVQDRDPFVVSGQ